MDPNKNLLNLIHHLYIRRTTTPENGHLTPMSRPEHENPPELFYDEREAKKYNKSSRIINIQKELTVRAIELLMLPQGKKSVLLDVGCGSGTFSNILSIHVFVSCC
jgi:hypothetical protein